MHIHLKRSKVRAIFLFNRLIHIFKLGTHRNIDLLVCRSNKSMSLILINLFQTLIPNLFDYVFNNISQKDRFKTGWTKIFEHFCLSETSCLKIQQKSFMGLSKTFAGRPSLIFQKTGFKGPNLRKFSLNRATDTPQPLKHIWFFKWKYDFCRKKVSSI